MCVCVWLANSRCHVFFTESRQYVVISSVTSPHHVTDVYVYTAPSVDWRHGLHGGVVCRLANVYYNDAEMSVDVAPFYLYPGNDSSSSNYNESNNDDYFYNTDNSCVSLYVQPRDMAADESHDPVRDGKIHRMKNMFGYAGKLPGETIAT